MYRYVSFEEIEKEKWNGTVHYSPNGNVFGYYWYLKAVLREWDAIIEDDYESVIPVIKNPLYQGQYALIPFLGPYSVNYINQSRLLSLLNPLHEEGSSSVYPLNQKFPAKIYKGETCSSDDYYIINTKETYSKIRESYNESFISKLDEFKLPEIKLTAGIKPEEIVEITGIPNIVKNTLLRIMYNAMHRGIGFSNGMTLTSNDSFLAVSFYLVSHNTIFELFSYSKEDYYRLFLLDLLIQNQAGKPMQIMIKSKNADASQLGFKPFTSHQLVLRNSLLDRIRRNVGMSY